MQPHSIPESFSKIGGRRYLHLQTAILLFYKRTNLHSVTDLSMMTEEIILEVTIFTWSKESENTWP